MMNKPTKNPQVVDRVNTSSAQMPHAERHQDGGYIILLNVDVKLRNLLVREGIEQLDFDEMSNVGDMFTDLEKIQRNVDALVLGVQLKDPVRIAQRIHAMGKDIPLLILTEPERYEQLKQALRFAPFISSNVIPWSIATLEQCPGVLLETVRRTQKRRSYRGSIQAAQKRLGDVPRERPQITHYLDSLLDHAPIGVLNVDIKGSVLGLNRCASQILKRTEREVLGTSLIDIFPLSERESLHDLIAQCVAPARQRSPVVFDISETVGTVRYVEVMASSLVDRSGQLGASVILQDITARVRAEQERQKAEEALRISEGRYRELVQTMSEALVLTDEQHCITFVNDSFCQMFGYSCDEVQGKPLLSFVHLDDRNVMRNRMFNAEQNNTIQRYETTWITKDNDRVTTLTSPKQIFDPVKGYVGCLGVFTDITERKIIEEREKKHLMEMAHVSRVTTLGEMSSQIAHELSQPLAAISALSTGSLKMMKSSSADRDEIIGSLSDISQQSSRAREVVLRLRNFVRNEEIKFTPVKLNNLVRTVVHLVEMEARWHSLPVTLELQKDLPMTLCDRILIEQVVLNLVHNAIEAMQEVARHQRRLTIRTSCEDEDTLKIEVIDSGPGISKEDKKKIFKPFYTTKSNGMGMGLAIIRSIVSAHKGNLSAFNNNETGATFCFTLPAENGGVERGS